MKTLFTFFITFFLLHLPAFQAKALDKDLVLDPKTSTLIPKYVGKVKVISGKVIIGERELKKDMRIYPDELVQTSDKSYIVIEMTDLTTITLGPKSDFKVEGWSFRTKNDRDAVFSVIKGQWRALVRSKSKDDDQLKIKTPSVSMGIRGTELMVNVNNSGPKEITQVALLEGRVHIGGEKPQDLGPGDHAIIIKDQQGFEHKDRKLTTEEIKSYHEFMAPNVLRLLEPIVLEGEKEALNTNLPATTVIDSHEELLKKEKINEKSLQENLEILNTTREKNLKQ